MVLSLRSLREGRGMVQEWFLEEEISLAGKGWLDLEHQWDKLEGSWQRTQ